MKLTPVPVITDVQLTLSVREIKALINMGDAARVYFKDRGNGQFTDSERNDMEALAFKLGDWNPILDD